jgi:hypothetical protein
MLCICVKRSSSLRYVCTDRGNQTRQSAGRAHSGLSDQMFVCVMVLTRRAARQGTAHLMSTRSPSGVTCRVRTLPSRRPRRSPRSAGISTRTAIGRSGAAQESGSDRVTAIHRHTTSDFSRPHRAPAPPESLSPQTQRAAATAPASRAPSRLARAPWTPLRAASAWPVYVPEQENRPPDGPPHRTGGPTVVWLDLAHLAPCVCTPPSCNFAPKSRQQRGRASMAHGRAGTPGSLRARPAGYGRIDAATAVDEVILLAPVKVAIDELRQIWRVVHGEMNLPPGPCPETRRFVVLPARQAQCAPPSSPT